MKAVILAAWFGTRMLPITKTIPKELLPVWSKPIIQYAVEWLVSAWIKDIIFVTSQSKKALEDYFDKNYELEDLLKQKWKTEFLEKINQPKELANIIFVKQKKPLWTWHAVWLVEPWINDDYFFLNYWDEIYPQSVYSDMIDMFKKNKKSVMMLFEVPKEDVFRYWVVEISDNKIINFVEKPKVEEAPSNLIRTWVWIFHKSIFKYLHDVKPNEKNWEIYLTDAIITLMKKDVIIPYLNNSWRWDVWNLQWRLYANNEIVRNWKLF